MKVIVLTSNYYLAANIALKAFLDNKLLKKHNVQFIGIVAVNGASFSMKTVESAQRFIKRSGLMFFVKVIFVSIWQKWVMRFARIFIPNQSRQNFELEELAEQHGIPYLEVDDVNGDNAYRFMYEKKPDYLVSSLLLHVIKPKLLSLPQKGAINFHPALVQKHRGTFANFWTIFKKWKRAGATVHFMTDKVDEGKVIIQKRFFVKEVDTMFDVNKRSARIGGNLLAQALAKLAKKEGRGHVFKKLGNMFTVPKYEEIKEFLRRGKEFIKFKNLFEI